MGDTARDRLSDRGSIPLRSIFNMADSVNITNVKSSLARLHIFYLSVIFSTDYILLGHSLLNCFKFINDLF